MAMTFNEYKILLAICGDEKYKSLTIDLAKDKFTGRYPPGLTNLFKPNSSPF